MTTAASVEIEPRLTWCRAGLVLPALVLALGYGATFAGEAPLLPLRNYQPVQLVFLNLPAEDAAVTTPGRWQFAVGLAVSNSMNYALTADRETELLIDLETTRMVVGGRYGLTSNWEVGLELPVIRRGGGVLDGPIEVVEELVGALNPEREARPRGRADLYYRKGESVLVNQATGDTGLGDLTLSAKRTLWSAGDGGTLVAARLAVELPTGDEGQTFSNDGTDFGVGLVVERRYDRSGLVGNLNVVLPNDLWAEQGITTDPFVTAMGGWSFSWNARFTTLVQAAYDQSPLGSTGTEELEDDLWEIGAGFALRLTDKLIWQLGAVENLVAEPGADFSLVTNLIVTVD